jgi:hypothetical protein
LLFSQEANLLNFRIFPCLGCVNFHFLHFGFGFFSRPVFGDAQQLGAGESGAQDGGVSFGESIGSSGGEI